MFKVCLLLTHFKLISIFLCLLSGGLIVDFCFSKKKTLRMDVQFFFPPFYILVIIFEGLCSLFSERAVAPYSSTLAWRIPWIEEPGGLQSMGSRRVRHDWATSLSLFTFLHWRRKWQLTPVFLPGESQGQRSLVGCRLWGCTESDTTEVT